MSTGRGGHGSSTRGRGRVMDPRNPSAAALRSRGPGVVINKASSEVQMTAEQLLYESFDLHRRDHLPDRPELLLTTPAELAAYREVKRREFEALVQRDTSNLSNWLRYATWEVRQDDLRRARLVFERTLEYHSGSGSAWLEYVESECAAAAVNHARNLLVRATTANPAQEALWLRFLALEMTLSNWDGAREVFRSWVQHQPDAHVWRLYAQFEADYGSVDSLRALSQKFLSAHNEVASWLLVAQLEADVVHDLDRAETILRAATGALPAATSKRARIFIALARVHVLQGRRDQARLAIAEAVDASQDADEKNALRRFALDMDRSDATLDDMLESMYDRRRDHYETQVAANPGRVDVWWRLLQVEQESGATHERLVDVYERACFSWFPPGPSNHRLWSGLFQLVEAYAAFLEVDVGDTDGAVEVLSRAVELIEEKAVEVDCHRVFLALCDTILRTTAPASALKQCRDTLERALRLPAATTLVVLKRFLQVETQVGNVAASRRIHELLVQNFGHDVANWIAFAKFEAAHGSRDAVDRVFERAEASAGIENRDALWVSRIALCLQARDVVGARRLHDRLLSDAVERVPVKPVPAAGAQFRDPEVERGLTRVLDVLQVFTQFEFQHGSGVEGASQAMVQVRAAYSRTADELQKKLGLDAAKPVFEAWRDLEARSGDAESLRVVEEKMEGPSAKRRKLMALATAAARSR